MTTALITGASSGLGAEYARQLAARGADLVLVARDRAALEAVASEVRSASGIRVEVLPADLTVAGDLAEVEQRLDDGDRPVEVLVNNAGYGLSLAFADNEIDDEVRHLRLHVEATMRLAHAALELMLDRGHGRIVNVASVAAFVPMSTYSAAKAWVLSFSRWANAEYTPRGVTTTAVCPGFTHTSFHERKGTTSGEERVPGWLWLDAPYVVAQSLRDVARGKSVSIPSLRWKAIAAVSRLAPAGITARTGRTGR